MLSNAEKQKRHRQKKELEKNFAFVPEFLRKFFKLSHGWKSAEFEMKAEKIKKYFSTAQKNNANVRQADNILAEMESEEKAKNLIMGLIVRGLQLGLLPQYAEILLAGKFDNATAMATARRLRYKSNIMQIEKIVNFLGGEMKC